MDTLSSWIIEMVVWAGGAWMTPSYGQDPDIPWWGIVSGLLVLVCYLSATLGLLTMALIGMKSRQSGEFTQTPTLCE